ncbi:MAG: hypothetical protein A3G93_06825 [Nitrospinae bacterium RIFCSPLOWO2_12_FULL_45_22]|nr:MAG: hypothetical protein A3G93_06825 [Nitrospinae bacterium RIFCSPLOWO2_12_FULL_45_22]
MIRSIAEAISSACFSMFSAEYRDDIQNRTLIAAFNAIPNSQWQNVGQNVQKTNYNSPSGNSWEIERERRRYKVNFSYGIPDESKNDGCYLRDEKKGLCICCRLFGTSNKSVGEGQEGQEGFGGKVSFSDIKIENGSLERRFLRDHALSSPKPHHESFYLNHNGNLRGRKFYYHRPPDNEAIKTQYFPGCDAIELLVSGNLSFPVTYENLSDEELGLLLLSLRLDDSMCHKIGLGKPLGLGTIKIEFDEKGFKNINMFDRYKGKKGADSTEVSYFINKLKNAKNSFHTDAWEDLRAILNYPPINHGLPIKYPDRPSFFNYTANCTIKTCSHYGKPICEHPLPTAQEVETNTYKLHE